MASKRKDGASTELQTLKDELTSDKQSRRKNGVRKVITAMTAGKDVSSLFVDVLNCSQTPDLEMRKLVYSYLLNYARGSSDMSIMAVNSFMKATEDPLPLIRAVALRSMASMDAHSISEYLCAPLRKLLADSDPFVRKTAVLCIPKLHRRNPELLKDYDFADLKQYLQDPNPAVVANAVAALAEIQEVANGKKADISPSELNLLLSVLNECGEWGQVSILDFIAAYEPGSEREAKTICERVMQRLSHSNAGVVLSAVKVIVRMITRIPDEEFCQQCDRRMSNPLMTMLTWPPEIQHVALCNMGLILQQRPSLLAEQVAIFFVKYNDPLCVKLGKLDIITRLAAPHNISKVLLELKTYTSGVDIEFARRAVRAIGLCAIKIPEFAEACVATLSDLAGSKVGYIIQEAIVVLRDIFRKYPNKYEAIISTLCDNLDSLDEPEAKAALIWMLGEYASRIDNSEILLASFLNNFHDEAAQVQLQLLTATVKLYLKKPQLGSDQVMKILDMCTKESHDPDLRDRGFIYWRLLSSDPAAAKQIVLSEKPSISEKIDYLEPTLLNEMIKHIGSLASVTGKPPTTLLGTTSVFKGNENNAVEIIPNLMETAPNDLIDFDDKLLMPEIPSDNPLAGLSFDPVMDFNLAIEPPKYTPIETLDTFSPWVSWASLDNIKMAVSWNRAENISAHVDILGTTPFSLSGVSLCSNSFGLVLSSQTQPTTKSPKHFSFDVKLVFQQNSTVVATPLIPPTLIVSTSLGKLECSTHQAVMFGADGQLTQFHQSWWNNLQATTVVNFGLSVSENRLTEELRKLNIFVLTTGTEDTGKRVLCASMKFDNSGLVLVRFVLSFGEGSGMAHVICPNAGAREVASQAVKLIVDALN